MSNIKSIVFQKLSNILSHPDNLSSYFAIIHTCGHGQLPANMDDENNALLRASRARASLQLFGFRSFCAKSCSAPQSTSLYSALSHISKKGQKPHSYVRFRDKSHTRMFDFDRVNSWVKSSCKTIRSCDISVTNHLLY